MANGVNWTGNKVLNSSGMQNGNGMFRTASKPAAAPAQKNAAAPPPPTVQQNGAATTPGSVPESSAYDLETLQGPPPSTEKGYIPYYLASNIGKSVRADFIIGTNQYIDKTGILTEVGINYFVLYDVNSRTNIMCDLYSVKFVTVLQT